MRKNQISLLIVIKVFYHYNKLITNNLKTSKKEMPIFGIDLAIVITNQTNHEKSNFNPNHCLYGNWL